VTSLAIPYRWMGTRAVIGAINRTTVGNANGAPTCLCAAVQAGRNQAELLASDAAANDNFGWSVSVSGDTVVVGAPYHEVTDVGQGAAYVFVRSGITWTQQQELLASDEAANDKSRLVRIGGTGTRRWWERLTRLLVRTPSKAWRMSLCAAAPPGRSSSN